MFLDSLFWTEVEVCCFDPSDLAIWFAVQDCIPWSYFPNEQNIDFHTCSNLHLNCKTAMWLCQMHILFTYCSLMFSPNSYTFCLKPQHDRDLRIMAHLVTSPFIPRSSPALQKSFLLCYYFSPFLNWNFYESRFRNGRRFRNLEEANLRNQKQINKRNRTKKEKQTNNNNKGNKKN